MLSNSYIIQKRESRYMDYKKSNQSIDQSANKRKILG